MNWKSVLIFILCGVVLLPVSAGGKEIPQEQKGVYRLYDFDSPRQNMPAPKGYEVFYLSHYGRHGARYIHNEREYDTLNIVLHREALTPYGEAVKNRFDEYYPCLKGRATDLSEVGKAQHRMLAGRMIQDYPGLFRKGSVVEACSSDIPRCMMSMFNFLDELKQRRKGLDVRADFNSSMVPLFRAPQVKTFPMKEYIAQNFDPRPLFCRLFADPQAAAAGTDACLFAQTMFYYACHLEGVGIEDDFFDSVLTEDEISALLTVENEKFSYHRGNLCPENTLVAGPSLEEIIRSAEKDIASGGVQVRLRFGHDNMIMNLMSLLGVKPFEKARFDSSDIPMASNIRFVFARNRSSEIVVKIQYNENDVMEWTPWEEFLARCNKLIARTAPQRSLSEHNSCYNPKLIAHRGLQSCGPENSLAAFKAAAQNRMWAIETDFRITADGHVVCMHDKKLDRTTDGSGLVSQMTLEKIKELKIKPVNTKTVVRTYEYDKISDQDLRVPTMDEYLDLCRNSGSIAFIELKEDKGVIEAMIASIEKHQMHERCVISSGKLELLERYRALGGRELVHLIFAKPEQIDPVLGLGNASVSFKYSDLDAEVDLQVGGQKVTSLSQLVALTHSLGLKVCFRAADSQEEARKHIALDVDYMPTNVLPSLNQPVL